MAFSFDGVGWLPVLANPLGNDAPVEVPHGVRAVIRERLSCMPDSARALLEAAAVLGDECDPSLLRAMLREGDPVDDAVSAGKRAGILVERSRGRVRFSHALYRETLYGDLSAGERRSLHAAALAAYERRADDTPATELAHHALEAREDVERALELTMLAADQCIERLAYDEALSLYERAEQSLTAGDASERVLGELLLARGLMQIRLGEKVRGQELCKAAAELATRASDADLLARAALGYGNVITAALVDPVLVGLLERALSALDDTDGKRRVMVMARLAAARHPAYGYAESLKLAQGAIESARRLNDDRTLLEVLFGGMSVMMDYVDPNQRIPPHCASVAASFDRAKPPASAIVPSAAAPSPAAPSLAPASPPASSTGLGDGGSAPVCMFARTKSA